MTMNLSEPTRRSGRGHSVFRPLAALLLGASIAILAVTFTTTPALAHNFLVSSTPEAGEVLGELPQDFVITTNDNLLDLEGAGGGFFFKVTGPDGLYYGDGCVSVEGPSASMPAALGPSGDYTLEWQVISADGHTVSDVIPFSWQPSSPSEAKSEGSATVPGCGAEIVGETPGTPADAAGGISTDILWIGGGVLALAIAIVTTLVLAGRRSEPRQHND